MAGWTRRLAVCGACGRKGVYMLHTTLSAIDLYTVRCRYCKRERNGLRQVGSSLESEAVLLGLIDTPGQRVTNY
jgi:hypothetical protein